jgi:FkbM family methyltransferase
MRNIDSHDNLWAMALTLRRRLRTWLDQKRIAKGLDPVCGRKIHAPLELTRLGSDYGGWVIPVQWLKPGSICYGAGVGMDISFDLELIRRFDVDVFAFDPTPRAVAFVQKQTNLSPRFHFTPVGLWEKDQTIHFHAPANPRWVSHSILNLTKSSGGGFDAPCRRISSLMAERGHQHLDLLKLDIEGAEYAVLRTLVEDRIVPSVLCIEFDEFHSPLDSQYRAKRMQPTLESLVSLGLTIVHADEKGHYTFVRNELLQA